MSVAQYPDPKLTPGHLQFWTDRDAISMCYMSYMEAFQSNKVKSPIQTLVLHMSTLFCLCFVGLQVFTRVGEKAVTVFMCA